MDVRYGSMEAIFVLYARVILQAGTIYYLLKWVTSFWVKILVFSKCYSTEVGDCFLSKDPGI